MNKTQTNEIPSLFRLDIQVGNLDEAETFYEALLGTGGQRHAGARIYFEAGEVTLQIVDVSHEQVSQPRPLPKALYFEVEDLEAVFARASVLTCLSRDSVHGEPGGEIRVRPWGERSFYAEDPWHNPLCFVESGTIYGR
ncbi:MAG: VOC family protein [Anaerolineales bacterium]|nr:VOC family protein [Anaerolineales bacterium]